MNKLNKLKIVIVIVILAVFLGIGSFFIYKKYIKTIIEKAKLDQIIYTSNDITKENKSDYENEESVLVSSKNDESNLQNVDYDTDKKEENRKKTHIFTEEKTISEASDTVFIQTSQDKTQEVIQIMKYKIIYRTNGGSEIKTIYVDENNKAIRPEQNPTKEDATFIDWFTDKQLSTIYDFNTPVTQNTILYAGWRVNVDSSIVTAVNNFKLKNTIINKNGNNVRVSFSSSSMNIISMESALKELFKNAASNNNYKSVYISYNGKGFDYLNYSEKLEPLRFIGWFGKDNWSGSAGFDCISGDFIGKAFNIQVKLKDGYLSENDNKIENYQISFGG